MKPEKNRPAHRLKARLWLAAGGVFIAALAGWVRLIMSLANADFYQSLGIQPGPWYLMLSGALEGIVYTLAGIFILSKSGKRRTIVTILLVAGLAIFWADRVFVSRSPEAQVSLPYTLISSAGLSLLAYCLAFWDTIEKRIRNG